MNIKMIRTILLILIFIVFGVIFKFSSENSGKSNSTSGGVINTIVDTHPATKNLEEYQKQRVRTTLKVPVRKMAHFTIYAILGILLMTYASTYDAHIAKKIILSLLVGAIYACTDEFHQMFVSGRSAQITDVGIDTLGVSTGIILVILQTKIVNLEKTFRKRNTVTQKT